MAHEICWAEIVGPNLEAAKKFYGSVFGWGLMEGMPGYAMFQGGEQHGCGFMAPKEGMPQNGTILYVSCDRIETKLADIQEHGGRVVMPKTEVPGHGWFALFQDPNGNVEGLWTAAAKPPAAKPAPKAKKPAPKAKKPAKKKK
jgi:hypothetical protein